MVKKKLLAVFGTRPEAVKMCPLVEELKGCGAWDCRVAVTAQHRGLLDEVLSVFSLTPDYDLNLMQTGQSLFDLTAGVMNGLRPILTEERPDLVLVHGDTTTAFGAALACFYLGIPVGHVEAGLRTYDLSAPFPEEWNRRAVGLLARYHFAPTVRARDHLLAEGVAAERVAVTGNTVLDALRRTVRADYAHPILSERGGGPLVLLTVHRRENRGRILFQILAGIRRAAEEFPHVTFLWPIHPAPEIGGAVRSFLSDLPGIRLCEPLGLADFHNLLARCDLCVTDSGGVQEEAVSLSCPTLVLRNTTERPEGIATGGARLVGVEEGTVYRGIRDLLSYPALRAAMSATASPYGDGRASRRIADFLREHL